MPHLTRRRVGQIIQGVLRILSQASEEGLRAAEVIRRLEQEVPPTEFERQNYPNRPGVRRYEKTVRFATIGPVKAGWLIKTRGRWKVTPAGTEALHSFPDPEALNLEAHRLYQEWAMARPGNRNQSGVTDGSLDPDENDIASSLAIEEAEESAGEQVDEYLRSMDPFDVQRLVAGLLEGMGYHVAWVAPPGPDHGFDIVAHPDPIGARDPTIKVAVRRRAQPTDVRDLREFLAVLHPSEVGIFVSIGGFTRAAQDLARQEERRIRLMDGERLFRLWVEHYSRIPDENRRLLPIRAVWFLDLGTPD